MCEYSDTCLLDRIMSSCSASAQTDPQIPLCVIGVLSADGRASYRTIIRQTWLRDLPPQLVARFVVRGDGGSGSVVEEARAFSDMVLVRARASLSRAIGPLHSLFAWWRCALETWPRAWGIAKADDDVWIDLRGVAWQLEATRAALTPGARLLWGVMETYSWLPSEHMPLHFAMKWGTVPTCSKTTTLTNAGRGTILNISGPFHFAKGPLFALSAPLASEMLQMGAWRSELDDLTRMYESNRSSARRLPWEDVYTGHLLSTAIARPSPDEGPLMHVHAGLASLAEPFGACEPFV